MTIKEIIKYSLRYLFTNRKLYWFNYRLYTFSLRAMGVMNYENDYLRGENNFFKVLKVNDIKLDRVFDVGANIGEYSTDFIKRYPKAEYHLFEINENTYSELSKNMKQYDNVILNSQGLGEKEETKVLYDYDRSGTVHASLFKDVIEKAKYSDEMIEIECKIGTLDAYCFKNGIEKIDFLKIDTEGNEFNVLKGSKNMIEKNAIGIIQFEFNSMNVYSRTFFIDFINLLENYNFYRILPDGLLLIADSKNYNMISCEIFAYQNIIAINKEHAYLSRIIK